MINMVIKIYHISELISMFNYENTAKGGVKLYSKFEKMLQKKGITTYRVSKDTGIPANTFSDWKHGRSNPKVDKLKILANYFGVSIEYFLEE